MHLRRTVRGTYAYKTWRTKAIFIDYVRHVPENVGALSYKYMPTQMHDSAFSLPN